MNESCLPAGRRQRQEAFWGWVDDRVNQLVQGVVEQTLELEMQFRLQADWNERTAARQGYRNGHYRRRLTTPHGPLSVRIPRCRSAGLDCSPIFDPYQRRISDVLTQGLQPVFLRRRNANIDAPAPSSASVAGSGTVRTVPKLLRTAKRSSRFTAPSPPG